VLSWSLIFLTLTCLSTLAGFGIGPSQPLLLVARSLSLLFLVGFAIAFLRERKQSGS
jgi:uncharacterized membrane protein YtjA (UPF0391 family)